MTGDLELTTVGDNDWSAGLATLGADGLDLLDDVHALNDGAKNDVLAVQPSSLDGAQEELGAVSAWAGIGHGEDAGASVLELEVLVLEPVTVDGLATSAVVVGEVTALAHELLNDAVERGALVAEALFSSAESAEVSAVFGTTSDRSSI